MKTLGLALGGGGSRGVAHVGFLKALEEAEIPVACISGCSMGAVIGAGFAAGLSADEMRKVVCALRFFSLISLTHKRGGFSNRNKMRRLLTRYIGEKSFSELKIPYSCIAVDMLTQRVVSFSDGDVVEAVSASAAIPSIFLPLEKDGMRLIDGCVLRRVPVEEVKAMGAEVVVAVDVLGFRTCKEKLPGSVGVLCETFDIMDNARTQAYKREKEGLYDLWIEPDMGDMSQYTFRNLDFAYQKGYEAGRASIEKIKALLED